VTTYSLTLRSGHMDELTDHLLRSDGCEQAAYVLCSQAHIRHEPWNRQAHKKYLSTEVILVTDGDVIESKTNLITWNTASFVRTLKLAQLTSQIIAVVHNHPVGVTNFSSQDDANEPDLLQLSVNRNGEGAHILSLILTADRQLSGRIWLHPSTHGYEPLEKICVIGANFDLHYQGRGLQMSMPSLNRQALAFGDTLNQDFRKLRVGVVGCGGTGSAVSMLLARLGIGHLVLIDNDIVDQTNLNRLHGSRQADADAMRSKVEVLTRSVTEMGLGVKAVPIEAWVGDQDCRDALRSCDIIFGCTDDHEGRLFLNRFSYYYLTPVIDIGLAIDVDHGDPPSVKALDGRVTVLGPPQTCILCRNIIDPEIARSETMRRATPEEYERRKAESYVIGEGNPSPAVVTFTTELACVGVNEMIHRLQGFRGPDGAAANRVRKFHLCEDRRPRHKPHSSCTLCANKSIWGKGDVEPFLGRI